MKILKASHVVILICLMEVYLGSILIYQYFFKKDNLPYTQFGIDILQKQNFQALQNCNKIGVLTNIDVTNSKVIPTYRILNTFCDGRIACFFAPERGFFCNKKHGEDVPDEFYQDIPIYSLYHPQNPQQIFPTEEQLSKIDSLVIDLEDTEISNRPNITCMRLAIEQCIRYRKKVILLDRPNRLPKMQSKFFLNQKNQNAFVGFDVLHFHGMTIGELANFFLKHYKPYPVGQPLTLSQIQTKNINIIPMKNYMADYKLLLENQYSIFLQPIFLLKAFPMDYCKSTLHIFYLLEKNKFCKKKYTEEQKELIGDPVIIKELEEGRLTEQIIKQQLQDIYEANRNFLNKYRDCLLYDRDFK